ncbi:MAG TPA: NB-ARC domain-containing protein, partial [Anaerolineales bacterium]|nr:NB-ARC domain-containing protein [Anaerolineales bacterium]
MKGSSYRDRDYAFGQTMLTLRTKIGLTQTGLADFLGVSRRTVGDWEAGNKYPNAEHLSEFIALIIKRHAFPVELEAHEAHVLWHASHQKVLLDEAWLNGLISHKRSPSTAHLPERPRTDWGDALAVQVFYGRDWEMNLLTEWVVKERCRVVSIVGLGGIGKSALSVSLMHQVAEDFDVIIWRSLRDLPDYSLLLDSLLQAIAPHTLGKDNDSIELRQSLLLDSLRKNRVLLVLDNLESVLEEGKSAGHFLPEYEGLGRLLRLSAETEHQSCVLITSREKSIDLVAQEGSRAPVRALRLARLGVDASEKLLAEKEVKGSALERAHLIEIYTGNPLALKIVGQTIAELFDGEIAPFLNQGEVIFGGVRELLSEQFDRLSALEQSVMFWLAILREQSTIDELLAVFAMSVPRVQLLEAIEALHRRSLIERGQKHGSFILQSVVLEYVTSRLVMEVSDEILMGKLVRLIEYGLELAQAREYIRHTQERLIIAPILANLHRTFSQTIVA